MTDRPIIFSAPMVRALLDGRKTQTRRVLRDQPVAHPSLGLPWLATKRITFRDEGEARRLLPEIAPYASGDRLWVREAHAIVPETAFRHSDGVVQTINPTDRYMACIYREGFDRCAPKWRPSIHMPRWASRITLLVDAVRVEPLQDISEDDARAEGCGDSDKFAYLSACKQFEQHHGLKHGETATRVSGVDPYSARWSFANLWFSLHGPDAWTANPWVAVITFSVVLGNIGSLGDRP
ncbi:hypothetical protein [Phaeospirillum tilakii]|uniref:ASCH domain-containing protein n=1 Tax=Phaeospirillum tilakii TaxID=741673 RepID=A0ABW5CC29_9PROT